MSEEVQTALTSHTGREIVSGVRGDDRGIYCPDCDQEVTATKGSHALPEYLDAERGWGWECDACENVMPSGCLQADAVTFNDRITGLEATFRDGSEDWIPVIARSVKEADGDE